jgi:hypothetical protein
LNKWLCHLKLAQSLQAADDVVPQGFNRCHQKAEQPELNIHRLRIVILHRLTSLTISTSHCTFLSVTAAISTNKYRTFYNVNYPIVSKQQIGLCKPWRWITFLKPQRAYWFYCENWSFIPLTSRVAQALSVILQGT